MPKSAAALSDRVVMPVAILRSQATMRPACKREAKALLAVVALDLVALAFRDVLDRSDDAGGLAGAVHDEPAPLVPPALFAIARPDRCDRRCCRG